MNNTIVAKAVSDLYAFILRQIEREAEAVPQFNITSEGAREVLAQNLYGNIARKPVTFWCHYCRPVREFVGTKCLTQLRAHYWAMHSPESPMNDSITLAKKRWYNTSKPSGASGGPVTCTNGANV